MPGRSASPGAGAGPGTAPPLRPVHGPAEHHPPQQAAGGDRVPHLGVHLLEDPRHRHEHLRARLQEVLGHGQALRVVDGDPRWNMA